MSSANELSDRALLQLQGELFAGLHEPHDDLGEIAQATTDLAVEFMVRGRWNEVAETASVLSSRLTNDQLACICSAKLTQVRALELAGQLPAALDMADQLNCDCRSSPAQTAARILRARLARAQGKVDESRTALREILSNQSGSSAIETEPGVAWLGLSDLQVQLQAELALSELKAGNVTAAAAAGQQMLTSLTGASPAAEWLGRETAETLLNAMAEAGETDFAILFGSAIARLFQGLSDARSRGIRANASLNLAIDVGCFADRIPESDALLEQTYEQYVRDESWSAVVSALSARFILGETALNHGRLNEGAEIAAELERFAAERGDRAVSLLVRARLLQSEIIYAQGGAAAAGQAFGDLGRSFPASTDMSVRFWTATALTRECRCWLEARQREPAQRAAIELTDRLSRYSGPGLVPLCMSATDCYGLFDAGATNVARSLAQAMLNRKGELQAAGGEAVISVTELVLERRRPSKLKQLAWQRGFGSVETVDYSLIR